MANTAIALVPPASDAAFGLQGRWAVCFTAGGEERFFPCPSEEWARGALAVLSVLPQAVLDGIRPGPDVAPRQPAVTPAPERVRPAEPPKFNRGSAGQVVYRYLADRPGQEFTLADLETATGVQANTISFHVRPLVGAGHLAVSRGQGRPARYRF